MDLPRVAGNKMCVINIPQSFVFTFSCLRQRRYFSQFFHSFFMDLFVLNLTCITMISL